MLPLQCMVKSHSAVSVQILRVMECAMGWSDMRLTNSKLYVM